MYNPPAPRFGLPQTEIANIVAVLLPLLDPVTKCASNVCISSPALFNLATTAELTPNANANDILVYGATKFFMSFK